MSHALPQPPGPCRIGGDLETEVSTTPKIAEGVTAFDSSYNAGYGLSGVAEDANGAESAGGGSAGTASPHVTDDVSDILNVDQGEQSRICLAKHTCFSPVSPGLVLRKGRRTFGGCATCLFYSFVCC